MDGQAERGGGGGGKPTMGGDGVAISIAGKIADWVDFYLLGLFVLFI